MRSLHTTRALRFGVAAFLLLLMVAQAQPYSLTANRAATSLGSNATTTTWTDVTDNGAAFQVTATIPAALGTGNVLVMASFTINPLVSTSDTGQWRLSDGTNTSSEIHRTLSSNTNDRGIATVTWLFTGVSGTKTYHLQHRVLLGNGVHTHKVILVALPMAVTGGGAVPGSFALNSGADSTGAYEFSSASATGATVEKAAGVDLSASIALPRPGRVFVASSFNCKPGASAALHVAQWELQVDGVTISTTKRSMQAAGGSDNGAVTLYGLAEGLATGTHQATILVKSVSGQTITTFNAAVAGVALSFDNDGLASTYYRLPAWVATGTNSLVAPGAGDTVTKSGLTYADGDNVFLASSYYSQTTDTNFAQIGSFRLYKSAGSTAYAYTSLSENRSLSGATDIGSGGNVGLAESLTAGTYSFSLEASNTSSKTPTMTTNAVLVGIGLAGEAVTAASISGQVYNTVGTVGIDGVTVELYRDATNDGLVNAGDTLVATQSTAGGGLYTFTPLAVGDYLVKVTDTSGPLTGYTLTVGTNPHDVALASAQAYTADFGYTLAASYTVAKTTTNGTRFTIGETIDYSVVISVPAGGSFTNVVVTDTLPVDIDAVTAIGQALTVTTSAGTVTTSVPSYNHTLGDATTAQVLRTTLGTVQNTGLTAGTVTITYTATVQNSASNNAGETKTNTVVVTADGPISDSDSVSVDIVEPQLSITKTLRNVTPCTPSRTRERKLDFHAPEPDDILEYTVILINATANASTAYNVTIVDTLDAGLEYITNAGDVDYSLPNGDIITAPDVSGQILTWGNGQLVPLNLDIPAGGSITFHYRVRVRAGVVAGQSLNNSATATWYSLDAGVGRRDGTGGVNDYSVTSSTATVTAWSDPATVPTTITVSGSGATIAADGTTGGSNITAGTLNGLKRLLLQDTAVVTVTGDGVPNHANGDPDPFGTPSANVEADASAVIITDGSRSFFLDEVILNARSTLELQGDSAYRIGSVSMGEGSTLILPAGARLEIVGSAAIQGTGPGPKLATIQPSTTNGGLTLIFDCSANVDYASFAGIGSGYVRFIGPTTVDHAVFSGGNGTNPYIKYEYPAAVTWTNLAFRKEDGATTTIQNTQASANTYYVAVAGYLGPTDLNYIGGDSTDIEPAAASDAVSAVRWSGATPAFGVKTSSTAPETGGVLIQWSAQVELGVLKYLVQVADGAAWTTVGDVFACAEGLSGGSYEYLDRLAQPGEPRTYRLLCVDVDGRSREHAVGTIAAVAVAPALAKVRGEDVTTFPPDGLATVEVLTYTVQRHATETPAILGTARKATVATGGLYGTGGVGRVYNVGRELRDLGGMVYIRPYNDPYTDANVVWGNDDALTLVGEPGTPPPPPAQGLLGPDGYTAIVHVEKDETLALNSMLPPGPNWFYGVSWQLAPGNTPTIIANVPAPALTGTAAIRIALRSTTAGAHDLGVTVNGVAVARATWTGQGHHLVQVTFDLATCPLRDGANEIELLTTATGSSKRLDYVEVITPATPALQDGSLVVGVLPEASGSLDVPGVLHAVDITEFGHESLLAVSRGAMGGLHAGQILYLTAAVGALEWSEPKDLTAIDTALAGQQYVAVAPTAWLDVLAPLVAKH